MSEKLVFYEAASLAVEKLGSSLYFQLERLDPDLEDRAWHDLPQAERDVYCSAVKSTVLLGRDDVSALFAYYDEINRRTEKGGRAKIAENTNAAKD